MTYLIEHLECWPNDRPPIPHPVLDDLISDRLQLPQDADGVAIDTTNQGAEICAEDCGEHVVTSVCQVHRGGSWRQKEGRWMTDTNKDDMQCLLNLTHTQKKYHLITERIITSDFNVYVLYKLALAMQGLVAWYFNTFNGKFAANIRFHGSSTPQPINIIRIQWKFIVFIAKLNIDSKLVCFYFAMGPRDI